MDIIVLVLFLYSPLIFAEPTDGSIDVSGDHRPDLAWVNWAMDDVDEMFSDTQTGLNFVHEKGELTPLGTDATRTFQVPSSSTLDGSGPSFRSSVRSALELVKDANDPELVISLVGHGLPGVIGRQCKNTGLVEIVEYKKIIQTIMEEIQRILNKRSVKLSFILFPCFSGTFFDLLQSKMVENQMPSLEAEILSSSDSFSLSYSYELEQALIDTKILLNEVQALPGHNQLSGKTQDFMKYFRLLVQPFRMNVQTYSTTTKADVWSVEELFDLYRVISKHPNSRYVPSQLRAIVDRLRQIPNFQEQISAIEKGLPVDQAPLARSLSDLANTGHQLSLESVSQLLGQGNSKKHRGLIGLIDALERNPEDEDALRVLTQYLDQNPSEDQTVLKLLLTRAYPSPAAVDIVFQQAAKQRFGVGNLVGAFMGNIPQYHFTAEVMSVLNYYASEFPEIISRLIFDYYATKTEAYCVYPLLDLLRSNRQANWNF